MRGLGARLRELDYDSAHLRARIGRVPDRLTPGPVASAEARAGTDDLATIIRLWSLGRPVERDAIANIIDDPALAALEHGAILRRQGSMVQPLVRVTPALGHLLVHDLDLGTTLSGDHVVGVGPATRTLAGLTPRMPIGRALDIGSGCGVQALRLSDHAAEVVATDLSPRAAWATQVSAALDGRDLDVRVGSGFEPVSGERFDLLVCNPPFVVSPGSELTFRDAQSRGDAISEALVRQTPSYLRPDGMGCLLVNWIVRADEPVTARPERWLEGLPVRALLFHHDLLDPLAYAQRWAMLPANASLRQRRASIDAWRAELGRLGARGVASGAIILQRTDAPLRVRVARMRRRPTDGGAQVGRMLAAIGRFSGADDPDLPTTRFRLVHGHRIDQRLHYGHGRYQAAAATIELDRSAGVTAGIPARALEAVFALDGSVRLSDLQRPPQPELLRTVLELYELGFVQVVEPGTGERG